MKGRVKREAAAVTVKPETARHMIRQVKCYGRRKVSAEAKVGIVMEGLRGQQAVAELCRREVIKERAKQERRARYDAWKKRKADLTAEEDGDTLSMDSDLSHLNCLICL